jgi:GMP synthase-like glutamine amidotransferase
MKWLSRHNTQDSPINILYTHGDMVESLPECAISLGGTDTVPIQAAVYFQKKSEEDQTPYAYTFQGHPEYVTNTGIKTFYNVLEAMNEKGKVSDESLMKTKKSCLEMFGIVEEDSIFVMKEVAKTFKWF